MAVMHVYMHRDIDSICMASIFKSAGVERLDEQHKWITGLQCTIDVINGRA